MRCSPAWGAPPWWTVSGGDPAPLGHAGGVGPPALELCLGREIELMIFAGEEIVVDPFSKESLSRTYPFPIFHSAAVVAEDPRAYLEERGLPLTKVHGDWNQARYPLEELGALPGVQLTASNDHDFELVPDRVDKGAGHGPDRAAVRRPPGGDRRRGGQRQRPVYAPGRRGCPSPWQCPAAGAGGGPADRPLQPGGRSSLGHLPLSGGK